MVLIRSLLLLLVLLLAFPMAVVAQSPIASSSIHDVGWLSGCWERRSGDRVTIEIWMVPVRASRGFVHVHRSHRLELRRREPYA